MTREPAPRPIDFAALEERLRARIAALPEGEVAVALVDLETGGRVAIDDTVVMHAASTMKVPVLFELYRQAEAGRIDLDDPVVIRNEFRSIADGSAYTLSPADDSEYGLYELTGQSLPARELARRMIVRSSNLALNLLIDTLGAGSVMRTMEELGAEGMRVLRGVEDIAAYRRGMNNTTTARGFARVLEAIARCELLEAPSCTEIVSILLKQEFNEMIPAGLPPGVRVAHKTGWIEGIQHDGGIVYPRGRAPYVLVILTRGIADTTRAARLGAELSREVWRALVGVEERTSVPADDTALELAALHERVRVQPLRARRFTQAELHAAIAPFFGAGSPLAREEVGRSAEGRPIELIRFGTGSGRVLLWSQMHGDESTATMALADIYRLVAEQPEHPVARRILEHLTVLTVPMLNPDGAERFQRRNAQGIDVNRDARALVSPEARALKSVQERFRPEYGFNLHDQNVRYLVGESGRLAAIALLAPPFDAAGTENEVRARAVRLGAVVRRAVDPLVAGHVSRYDDTFNPRAFGDLMQSWGVSTLLIESGGWRADADKQHLRRANFVAILRALDAIATGEVDRADPAWYAELPGNGQQVNDLILRGGAVVRPGFAPFRADVAIDFEDALARTGGRVVDLGDLAGFEARDTLDVTGLYVHAAGDTFPAGGDPAELVIRESAAPESAAVWLVRDGVPQRATPRRATPPAEPGR